MSALLSSFVVRLLGLPVPTPEMLDAIDQAIREQAAEMAA